MPRMPDIPCKHPGCPRLVPHGKMYCEEHAPMHTHDRETASERGYGEKWQRARRIFLASHPLCARCLKEKKITKATVVDHIIPHRGDPRLFWDQNNWQALCKRCHDRKTGLKDSRPLYTYK